MSESSQSFSSEGRCSDKWPNTSNMITWWRHQMQTFSALLAICGGIHWSPVNFPHKGQRCGALMFSLTRAWTNGRVNNRDVGDMRCHPAHGDVTVMISVAVVCLVSQVWIFTNRNICIVFQIEKMIVVVSHHQQWIHITAGDVDQTWQVFPVWCRQQSACRRFSVSLVAHTCRWRCRRHGHEWLGCRLQEGHRMDFCH